MRHFKRLRNLFGQGIRVYAILYILLGFLILGLEGISKQFFINGDTFWESISDGWKSLLESIGIVFFTLGIGTVTLELGEFTKYFIKRLSDVMLKDEYLDYIDPTKLEEMKQKIEAKLYFCGNIIGKENFYHIVQNALTKLLHSFYYKELFILVECNIDDNKMIIKKNIHKIIKIINGIDKDRNGKSISKISIPFGGEFQSIEGKTIDDIYKINSVILKKEKILDEHNEYFTEDKTKEVNDELHKILKERIKYKENEEGFYPIVLDFDYTFEACETYAIELDIETIVPITDNYYSTRLSVPCQDLTIVYNLINNDYHLDGFAFSFLKDDYGDAALIRRSENSMLIKFSDWVMPGEGIIISMKHMYKEKISDA